MYFSARIIVRKLSQISCSKTKFVQQQNVKKTNQFPKEFAKKKIQDRLRE